jgi:probable HAF family extracellular repeat protein
LWNGAKMLDIGQQAPLNGAGSSSTANGINDAGQVVGYYGSGSGSAAFLYSNGAVTSLPDPSFAGSDGCQAFAINNTGQIAGTCRDTAGVDHLVLWHNGTVTDLGTMTTPGNWSFTRAVSMNNNGQIAASVFIGGGTTEGFLYSNGALTSLGSFLPAAINDSGVMVGGPDIDSGSTVQDLNTMVPAGSPAIQDAATINVNGQIVSDGLLLNPS